MRVLVGILAVALMLIVLGDAFETIILPRRVTRRFRLTRLFYRYTWLPWRSISFKLFDRKRRERYLSFYGPISILGLLLLWAVGIILGFAMLQWACGSLFVGEGMAPGFGMDLYGSGTTFTTLGIGDVRPTSGVARFLMAFEAGTGFGFLAIVIGYLPVIYQAFSRREVSISLLDARAGSPPAAVELLRRYAENGALDDLDAFLHDWEHWAAELLESHISYPLLALFRSQHDNESWLSALTMILDVSALLMVGVEGVSSRQARLTFSMARHAVVDLAQVLKTPPKPPLEDRLPPADFSRMRDVLRRRGVRLLETSDTEHNLATLRRMYEPYVNALAEYLVLSLPTWLRRVDTPDNWQTSAWERAAQRVRPVDALDPTLDEHY